MTLVTHKVDAILYGGVILYPPCEHADEKTIIIQCNPTFSYFSYLCR
ncbi:hypothetical protein VCHA40P242_80115 [Vibrio chagasii]|nr:hypothetical protein VCHA40P242_80115 [Vibrio chagasii]